MCTTVTLPTPPKTASSSIGLAACVLAAVSSSALGAEFDPAISLGLIRTDNLTLTNADPEAATVWEVIPQFDVVQNSKHIDAQAAYQMEAYHYVQRGESEVFNVFDGEFTLAVVPERLFFDVGGSHTQTILDPQSTIPSENLAVSTNRADRTDYYLGPSFRVGAGGNAIVSGDVRRTWVRIDDDGQQLDYSTANVGVDNYRKGTGLTWAARYSHDETNYTPEILGFEFRRASLELGFWAGQGTRVFVAGGKESAWDTPLDPSLKDSFWEAGFARSVSERLTAELAVGERSFGTSRRMQVSYDFGRGQTNLSYDEIPTTNAYDRFDRGGLLNPDEPNDFLYRPNRIEQYISERLQWSTNVDLQRTNFVLTIFDESHRFRGVSGTSAFDDERQSGAILRVSWQAGSRTELVLNGARVDREFEDGEDLEFTEMTLTTNYRLGPRTSLAGTYDHRKEQSSQTGALVYRAKTLSARVTRNF